MIQRQRNHRAPLHRIAPGGSSHILEKREFHKMVPEAGLNPHGHKVAQRILSPPCLPFHHSGTTARRLYTVGERSVNRTTVPNQALEEIGLADMKIIRPEGDEALLQYDQAGDDDIGAPRLKALDRAALGKRSAARRSMSAVTSLARQRLS